MNTETKYETLDANSVVTIDFKKETIDVEPTTLTSKRHDCMRVDVQHITYDSPEKRASWWQRLSAVQMPWEWAHDVAEQRKHRILEDVSFSVKSGQMLAVLGSSGSGKTSLLDVLACRTTAGDITGQVFINGQTRTLEMIKQCAAYVRQDDRLLPHLTVRETLMFVAELKFPPQYSRFDISTKVDGVIAELGLRHVADSKVGGVDVRGISGGERRRVTIGVQMLMDPSILFLDEPTSGLDSFTAHHLVETLSNLAKNDRIVIMSIHQPRSDIFELFDLIMLLSEGKMVYYGKANRMVPYFTDLGHPCPEFTNPCDFYVDLVTVDRATSVTEADTSAQVHHLVQKFNEFTQAKLGDSSIGSDGDELDMVWQEDENFKTCLAYVVPTPKETNFNDLFQGGKLGLFRQFAVLLRRSLLNSVEDYGFLFVQAVEAFCMSLMIGLVYFNLPLDQVAIRDRFGMLFIVGVLYTYLIILDIIGAYHKERRTIYFEMQDGLYTAGPYFFSKVISDLPQHTFFMVLYVVPMYFLAGLRDNAASFFAEFGINFMQVYCSRCLAMWAGAAMPTYQIAVIFAQTFYSFFFLSSGYIINLNDIFYGVRWISSISYLKWGYQALCLIEFPGLNFTCPTNQPGQCIRTGDEALASYALNGIEIWHPCVIILGEIGVFLILFYLCIKFIPQKPHDM